MSHYTPAQRFDQHKAGIHAAGSVLRRGIEVLTGPTLHLQRIARPKRCASSRSSPTRCATRAAGGGRPLGSAAAAGSAHATLVVVQRRGTVAVGSDRQCAAGRTGYRRGPPLASQWRTGADTSGKSNVGTAADSRPWRAPTPGRDLRMRRARARQLVTLTVALLAAVLLLLSSRAAAGRRGGGVGQHRSTAAAGLRAAAAPCTGLHLGTRITGATDPTAISGCPAPGYCRRIPISCGRPVTGDSRMALYVWNPGYWGPEVGFYGGIVYGYGYFGHGYEGGYWRDHQFYYNRAVNDISNTNVTTVYNKPRSPT